MKFIALALLGFANAADDKEIGDKNWIYNFPDIGPKYPGYFEGGNLRNIRIDLYYDLFCSGCAHDNPIIQAFLNSEYSDPVHKDAKTVLDLVEVNYNYVPLPYHHASWIPAMAMQFEINRCYAKDTYSCNFHEFQNWNFENQDTYLAMVNNSEEDILDTYANDIADHFSFTSADITAFKDIYKTKFADDHDLHESIWWQTAQSYKQGTNHQVSGTPSIFINGIELDTHPTSVQEWT